MKSHPRASEILVESGAFSDLNVPVVLASGKLGIYCINAEKTLGDAGKWEELAKMPSSEPLIRHAGSVETLT